MNEKYASTHLFVRSRCGERTHHAITVAQTIYLTVYPIYPRKASESQNSRTSEKSPNQIFREEPSAQEWTDTARDRVLASVAQKLHAHCAST